MKYHITEQLAYISYDTDFVSSVDVTGWFNYKDNNIIKVSFTYHETSGFCSELDDTLYEYSLDLGIDEFWIPVKVYKDIMRDLKEKINYRFIETVTEESMVKMGYVYNSLDDSYIRLSEEIWQTELADL